MLLELVKNTESDQEDVRRKIHTFTFGEVGGQLIPDLKYVAQARKKRTSVPGLRARVRIVEYEKMDTSRRIILEKTIS